MNHLATLLKSGKHLDAEVRARELLVKYPDCGVLWKILGVALWSLSKAPLPAMQRAAELLPNDAEAHANLGNGLHASGQLDGALQSLRKAVALNPGYAEAHNNLGSVLQDLGRQEEAVASFRRAVAVKPDFALAHGNLGNLLSLLGRTPECEASCRQALDLDPNMTAAMVILAEICASRGQFQAAEDLLKRAIAIEPNMPEAWAGLARSRRMTREDSSWLTAVRRIAIQSLPPRREVHLRYALGKYFDDVGDYDEAYSHYRRANEIAKAARPLHDQDQFSRGIDRIIKNFDREWLSAASSAANASERPVLIVGMPRSGTTLMEQILASHAAVFGAGELPFWNAAAARYASVRGSDNDPAILHQLAEEYSTLLDTVSSGESRVVDKMPANFLYLGLIHAALPNARFIHMRRHPIDTCLSIYFQNFDAKHAYANDLNDLAHNYREYLRVMDHWRRVLPAQVMLDVQYESLVEDVEAWSRKVVEFIGLPWDANCLEFHHNDRSVDTASKWQARQKISRESVERWRHYEKFLSPLIALASASGNQGQR